MHLKLTRTNFINGRPTDKELSAFHGSVDFKRDAPEDDTTYCCDNRSAKVRRCANDILDLTTDSKLLEAIYEYGEANREEGNEDGFESGRNWD